jgi:hypothetical protein
MSKKDNIVDLVPSEDGTYTPKNSSKAVSKEVSKPKKKYDRRKADDFVSGLDAGLDFIEEIGLRVDRFFRLRG